MFPGCCPASVTDLLTLCWAPKCRAKVRPRCAVTTCRRSLQGKAKWNLQELARNRVFSCKKYEQRFSPHGCAWDVQSVGSWPWKVLLIQRVNCQPLLPAVPRIAASLKVKNSSQDFVLFHGWVVPSNRACSKRLFKETAGCTLRLCLISHTTLHSCPQTGSR